MSETLDMKQYEKLTGKSYKKQRTMREKEIGRWFKDGRKWKITVEPDDVIPGIPNDKGTWNNKKDDAQQELQLENKGESLDGWKLRKLVAETLLKEQQNDAFIAKLLNDFLQVFTEATMDSLQPVRDALQKLELPQEQAVELNRAWDKFENAATETADREVQKLLHRLAGGE